MKIDVREAHLVAEKIQHFGYENVLARHGNDKEYLDACLKVSQLRPRPVSLPARGLLCSLYRTTEAARSESEVPTAPARTHDFEVTDTHRKIMTLCTMSTPLRKISLHLKDTPYPVLLKALADLERNHLIQDLNRTRFYVKTGDL